MTTTTSNRRRFLGRMLATAGALSLPMTRLTAATPDARRADQAGSDDWLREVRGTHRCLFDFPNHKNGFGLAHIEAYLDTYESAYGAGAGQVGAVGTFYSMGSASSILMGFDDFIWQKYQLGEYAGLADANGRPYTRNVFHRPTEADGHLFSQAIGSPALPIFGGAIVAAGIERLQARGAKFIMCNNALGGWTYELAARGKGTQAAIDTDLRAHLLPGVTLVPAMVIAIEKAQAAGIAYNTQ